jgi:hypothetical protein
MVDLIFSMRGVMFIGGIVALLFYAHVVGTKFFNRGWSYRLTSLGFGGLITYATAIQRKAQRAGAPFDAYSWVGATALILLISGLSLYLLKRSGDSTDGT